MKIIKIISILAAIILPAIVLLPVVSGADTAGEGKNTPPSYNILQRFAKARSAKTAAVREEVSPLVKEANLFSLYLKPPPPPKTIIQTITPQEQNPNIPITTVDPIPSRTQFKLVMTCVNESNPDQSLALIDLPGEGLKWVRPSGKVGHLTIKEIKSGMVVAADNQQTINVPIEAKPAQPSLVKGQSSTPFPTIQTTYTTTVPAPSTSRINPTPTTRQGLTRTTVPSTPTKVPPTTSQIPTLSAEDEAFIQKFMGDLNVTTSATVTQKEEAMIQKFMNEIDAVSAGAATEEERIKKSDELLKKLFADGNNVTITKQDSANTAVKPDVKADANDPNSTRRQPPSRRTAPPQ